MKLRPELEHLRARILNRENLLALEMVVSEVLREETQLSSQASMENSLTMDTALAAYKSSSSSSNSNKHGYARTREPQSTKVFDCNDIYKMIQESLVVTLPNAISSALTAMYPDSQFSTMSFLKKNSSRDADCHSHLAVGPSSTMSSTTLGTTYDFDPFFDNDTT
ncbi:hypothetical protein H5410_022543 [Solanum commersonii]|uniref:Uncharacterized protein n=1 Tax=Solanum commersonii TaxID=4109 RepID=A0A9J5ZJF4_SOLCO|nr:hypothetical protein H5410_022543 [Solanum commersonii]